MADDVAAKGRSVAPDESPGVRLCRARKKKNLTTRQIAKKLHMDSWMLDAIERDEFSALGAPVFAKGHLRKYANELGLEPDDLMVAYYQLAGTRETPPLIAESILRMEADKSPRLGWLVPAAIVLGALAAVATGAVWYLRSDAAPRPAVAAPDPEQQDDGPGALRSSALALPTVDASDVSTAPARADAAELQPASRGPSGPATVPDESSPALPNSAERALEPAAEPAAAASGNDSVTLMLRFREESWVEVYDRDRNKLLYGMGGAQPVQYVSGPAPLSVFLGRYRDVELEVDGQPFPIPQEARRTNTARFVVGAPDTR